MDPACPTCGRPVDVTPANRARPFCSARCQLVDLGNWLDEVYVVPGEPAPEDPHPADIPGGDGAFGERPGHRRG